MSRLLIVCLLFMNANLHAQVNGMTHVPDTSFSNYSALQKILKQYPDARPVTLLQTSAITEAYFSYFQSNTEDNTYTLNCRAVMPKFPRDANGTAIMIIHGGGWRSGNPDQHRTLAQYLAVRGYTCFLPQYRLSTDTLYPGAIADLRHALDYLNGHAEQFHINPKKIAVAGFSAGGELAAFLGATNNEPRYLFQLPEVKSAVIAAVIDIDGTLSFVHPESGEGNDAKGPSAGTYWFGVSRAGDAALWEDASPLKHLNAGDPPFVFINSSVARMHAGRDDGVKLLNSYNIYTEVHEFADAPHVFPLFHPWFLPTVDYIDQFLKKALP